MTRRLLVLIGVLGLMWVSALSLGDPLFYYIALALSLMVGYALLSVLFALPTLRLYQQMNEGKYERGEGGALQLRASTLSPLPLAPLKIELQLPEGKAWVSLNIPFPQESKADFSLWFTHVGVWDCGILSYTLSDPFELFVIKRRYPQPPCRALVLPRNFEVDPLRFSEMDDGRALPNRSGEDVTSPEDIRSYRPGDPIKRIHWKLSSRKRELLVRRFEIPAPPDTLILLDCYDPEGGENAPDGLMRLRDTLCETALTVAKMQMEAGQPVRLPLYGARQSEFKADKAGSLSLLKEELALQIFRGGEPIERVLNLELRRMRRTGASVVITTRLNAQVLEGVKNIVKSGPRVRFYLITFTPDDPRYLPYIAKLQQQMVEVCYVTPA